MVLKYPLILITVFTALGIAAGFYLQQCLFIALTVFGAAGVLLVIAWWRSGKDLIQKPWFALAAWAMSFGLGMAVQQLHYSPGYATHYSHYIHADDKPVIRGVITERLKPNAFSEKYFFDVASVNKIPARGTILVTVPKDSLAKSIHAGDVLFIAATPQPITSARNPYQFDYAAYIAKQDVYHQLKLKQNYITKGQERGLVYYVQQLRDGLMGSFSIHNFEPKTMQVINALLFGQRQDMDQQTTDTYTATGVVHILAISGLHFSLLFLVVSYLLRPLKRVPRFGRAAYFTAVLFLIWGFALITGLSASVVRAAAMITIIILAEALNRRANIYNSLAVSMLVLLLAKPAFLFDAGFQLSYLAVLAIVVFQPLYKKLPRSKHLPVQWVQDTVAISLIAQIGVLPLTLYYFNQFPILFLVANVVVIPLSNLVLGLGIVTLLLNFTVPAIAVWVGKLLELSVTIMNNFIAWMASFDALVLKNIPFTMLLNVLLYAVILLGIGWLYKRSYRRAVAVLCSVMVFQLACMFTTQQAALNSELVVFHNYKSTLIAQKAQQGITVLANDSLALQNRSIQDYAKGSFNPQVSHRPLQNLLWHNGTKVLVLDSLAIVPEAVKPDVLLLTQSTKVNLSRVLDALQPKAVVADGTNYNNMLRLWAATCRKKNILFHATAEKGYYKIE